MAEGLSRKLAAILHADVVGSTRLVQQNEALAHARIQDAFRRFSLIIEAYNGVTHELRGDALVAEFARASDAVSAALAFQIENTESNARLEDDLQPQLRIGISLGEVVIADNTVTGAGVVLAQRVEQLAEPGGVCITGAIHEAVPRYLPVDYSDLGKREAKGFDESVHVFSAGLKAGKQVPSPEPAVSGEAQSRKSTRLWPAGAIALLVLVVAGLAWWQPWVPREEPASIERMAFPLPDKPSVAVLPFDNMTGDPQQDYFVDGMTDGIITMLAKVPQLFVSARNSTFTYKGKPVPVRQVAEELGVRYVLEGSVQRSEDRIRLNAQLIDALTGHHVWAEQYDPEPSDILTIQDQVAAKVVAALEVALTEGEQQRVRRTETSSPEAYDYYVRARKTFLRFTKADNEQARQLWLKAFELDPKYAGALASVGFTHVIAVVSDWSDDPAQDLKQATAYAEQSLAIDDTNPDAYALMGRLALFKREYEQAIEYAQRSVELSPSHADNTALLGLYLSFAGRHAEALQVMNRAMRLGPYYPNWYLDIVGSANRFLGNYDEAINALEQNRDRTPNSPRPYIWLASTYAEAGRDEAARAAAKELLTRNPKFSVKQFAKFQAWKNPEDLERLVDGLRKAGLPE